MNTLFEFFDKDPLENIVTCLNYKFDRVVYFGFHSEMDKYSKDTLENNLLEICNIKDVDFIEVSEKSYERLFAVIADEIIREKQKGSLCFFDITGGNEASLTAVGQFAATHKISVHKFDIHTNKITYCIKGEHLLEKDVPKQEIHFNINKLISFYSGRVEKRTIKTFKNNVQTMDREKINAIWNIALPDMKKWNCFCSVLSACKSSNYTSTSELLNCSDLQAQCQKKELCSVNCFCDYLKGLYTENIISGLNISKKQISFKYSSVDLRSILFDSGSILEIHSFLEFIDTKKYDDCKIGVHISWENDDKNVVYNEIDIMLLEGHIPTFISCKNGNIDQNVLYELETISNRFGGKYAKKELITAYPLPPHLSMRAKEMDIKVTSIT